MKRASFSGDATTINTKLSTHEFCVVVVVVVVWVNRKIHIFNENFNERKFIFPDYIYDTVSLAVSLLSPSNYFLQLQMLDLRMTSD